MPVDAFVLVLVCSALGFQSPKSAWARAGAGVVYAQCLSLAASWTLGQEEARLFLVPSKMDLRFIGTSFPTGKEFDLNRQCGVINPETKKICTRLLTCKVTPSLRMVIEGQHRH